MEKISLSSLTTSLLFLISMSYNCYTNNIFQNSYSSVQNLLLNYFLIVIVITYNLTILKAMNEYF